MTSTPTLVLLRCPPEMPLIMAPPIIVLEHDMSPRSSSVCSTSLSIVSAGVPGGRRRVALNLRASRGVAVAMSASSCMTYATFFLNETGSITLPLMVTLPSTCTVPPEALRPARTFRRDDLPAPDAPMMQQTSPLLTVPHTEERIDV